MIEKEQAYIDAGSWDDWDKMEEENEKERVKEQTRLDRKRKQVENQERVPQNARRFDRRPPLASHPVQCASERAVERHTRAPRYSSAEYRESS